MCIWSGSPAARACSLFYPEVTVGQDFRVQVLDRSQPIEGLTVTMAASFLRPGPTLRAVTDSNGIASFVNVAPGKYFLQADHDGGIPDAYDVVVRREAKTDQPVKLRWPNPKPLEVKSAGGRVAIAGSGVKRALEKPISLALVDAISNSVITVTETDTKGYFSFPTPNRGLYFIRLNHTGIKTWSGEEMTGDIPIEIVPDAIAEGVDLDLAWSSCGLYYSDMKQCRQPAVTVRNMCGEVFDLAGAVIAKADVYLLRDEHDEIPVAETTSDTKGRFSMNEVTPGTYELYVKATGFQSAHSKVHVSANRDDSSCIYPLPITLGLFGSCSSIGSQEKP